MSNLTIYTKTGCPYCAAAKKHYAEQGIEFVEINVTEQPEAKKTVLELTGGKAIVPVIVENGTVQAGFGGG
jgi:glutaredoxin 3